jgi:hypothetical protein
MPILSVDCAVISKLTFCVLKLLAFHFTRINFLVGIHSVTLA